VTVPCVCSHDTFAHHAHTGHCHDCTCSYYEPNTAAAKASPRQPSRTA